MADTLPQEHVLIVEDERALAHILSLKIQELGVKCTIASNGIEAFQCLNNNGYTLVLLDLLLPQMDGFEILQKMKEQKIDVPVIVLSVLSQPEDIARAKELGALEYFAKSSSSLSDIISAVKKYLA